MSARWIALRLFETFARLAQMFGAHGVAALNCVRVRWGGGSVNSSERDSGREFAGNHLQPLEKRELVLGHGSPCPFR